MTVAWVGAGIAAVGVVSSMDSSRRASNTQRDAANAAAAQQKETTDKTLEQQQKMYDANVARMSPFVESGKGALQQLQQGTTPGGQFMQKFDGANFQQDPSYKFRLDQGLKALQAMGAARGTAGSTQGMRDITTYAQGAASQEYQAAYGRFQDQQNTLFNRLSTVAGNSQNAAAGLGAQGTQVSSNMGQTAMAGTAAQNSLLIGGANAAAAGAIGQNNAIMGGISQGLNAYQSQQYLNSLQRQQTTPPANNYTGTSGTGVDYSLGNARFGNVTPD